MLSPAMFSNHGDQTHSYRQAVLVGGLETDASCELKAVYSLGGHISSSPVNDQLNISASQKEEATPATHMVSHVPTYTIQAAPMLSSTKDQNSGKTLSLSTSASNSAISTSNSVPTMQIPIIIQSGQTISMLQSNAQLQGQTITVSQSQTGLKPSALSQVVSAQANQLISSSQNNQTGELNTPLPVSTPSAISFMQGMTPGIIMYHTPQGVVYATPTTQNFHDRTIFNFPQTMSQADQSSGQQIISIPIPVSLNTPILMKKKRLAQKYST
ncbi:hypothetical protein Btru_049130 [Bulinus truncatus]|nr:hypothetical protein Btru_049130 [Bulinus truncatus]